MKSLIEKIDTTLGSIYEIDTSLRSSEFISQEDNQQQPGALLIRNGPSESKEIEVAIAFSAQVKSVLHTLTTEAFSSWNLEQSQAFSVAAEEISHFRYLIFHAEKDRQVSKLELEFHGEIDKFLLFHLIAHDFDLIFSRLFEHFSLSTELSPDEQERYLTANQLAREFIVKNRLQFGSTEKFSCLLKNLRALYRMSPQDKFSLKNRL